VSATSASPVARVGARLQAYGTRRHALSLGLAAIQLGLLVAAGWLVSGQVGSGPVQVFAVGLLGLIAAVVLLSPGSAAALVFIVGCGLCYLVLSALEAEIGVADRVTHAYQVLGLAAALFLVHAVDALREALPTDAAVEPAVLMRWVRRVAEALGPGLLVGGVLVALPTATTRGGVFWLLGALAVLLAVGLPALTMRPRPWGDGAHPDQ